MIWNVSWSEVRNTSLPKLATLHVPSGKSNELVESSEWSHSESQFIIQECPLPTRKWKVVTLRAWVQNSPATLYRKSRWVLPLEFADYLRPGGDSQHTGTRQYCWCPRRVKPASLSRDPFIVRNMADWVPFAPGCEWTGGTGGSCRNVFTPLQGTICPRSGAPVFCLHKLTLPLEREDQSVFVLLIWSIVDGLCILNLTRRLLCPLILSRPCWICSSKKTEILTGLNITCR